MFADDVRDGLTKPGQKTLPCEYFYDAVGSALFEAITVLPEYGLTRADARLIRRLAPELEREFRSSVSVVELGSGSGTKTRWILESLRGRDPVQYYPIDVSASALAHCAQELSALAQVFPVEGSYLSGLHRIACQRPSGKPLLVLFLGSTIGNFDRAAAGSFLCDVRQMLRPGDALLVGADLVKAVPDMLLAYDDPAGVTAAFNLNLLARINRELEADFKLRNFVHEARYDDRERRIEMHLRSKVDQRICVRGAGFACEFERDETIWTESCHKFHAEEICEMGSDAGFTCAAQWIDEQWPFAESLLIA